GRRQERGQFLQPDEQSAVAGLGGHRRRHAHHLARRIHQRPAAVALVDRHRRLQEQRPLAVSLPRRRVAVLQPPRPPRLPRAVRPPRGPLVPPPPQRGPPPTPRRPPRR